MNRLSKTPVIANLERTDNLTNWFYLLRTYLLLAIVIGAVVWFIPYRRENGLNFFWNVAVITAAAFIIGALQHHLYVLGHEATHRLLFRNKYLNDLAADWLCLFPLLSCTQHSRMQQLAHHQFVNDPDLDQEIVQLRTSGHWPAFPLDPRRFVRLVLGQLWFLRGLRFNGTRTQFHGTGVDKSPYLFPGWTPVKTHHKVGKAYFVGLGLFLVALSFVKNMEVLIVVPVVAWVGIMIFYAAIPTRWYYASRIQPVLSFRTITLLRFTFITLLFSGLAWITLLTGRLAVVYYALLWWLPLSTTFTLFMLLRQLAQHGNAGRGQWSLSRVFAVGALWKFCAFPLGQAYHLPHHLFPGVPHYRLRRLHEMLLAEREYAQQAVVVRNLFGGKTSSVTGLLAGPPPASPDAAFVDSSVLDKETHVASLPADRAEAPSPSGMPRSRDRALRISHP